MNNFRSRKKIPQTERRRIILLFIYSRLLFSCTWEGHATLFCYSPICYSVGFASRFTRSRVYLSIAPSGLGKALTFSPTTWRIQAKEEKQPRTWGKGRFQVPLTTDKQPRSWAISKIVFLKNTPSIRSDLQRARITIENGWQLPIFVFFRVLFCFGRTRRGALKQLLVSDWIFRKWE